MIHGVVVVTAVLAAQVGEGQVLREGAGAINAQDVHPERPLITRERMAYTFAGLAVNLSSGGVFEPVTLPFGFAYGIVDVLEAGVEVRAGFNRPDPLSFAAVSEPRLHARYALVPGMLALEGSVFIPVGKELDAFGFRVEAPFRWVASPAVIVLASASYAGFLGSDPAGYADYEQIGATALYSFAAGAWVAIEVGLSLRKLDLDTAAVPVGLAGGWEVVPGIAILPGVRFPDITTPSARVFQVLATYTFDLGGREAEGAETPDIPLGP